MAQATQTLTTSRDLYQSVTTRILAELESGAIPWIKPRSATAGANVPCNAVTNRPYSGCNVILLWMAQAAGYPLPRFVTYRQAQECGGNVRKGEHGYRVYFVKQLEVHGKDDNGTDETRLVPMLREYTVFNACRVGTGENGACSLTRHPAALHGLQQPRHAGWRGKTMKQYGLPMATAAHILAALERDLHAPSQSVTQCSLPQNDPFPEPPRQAKKLRMTMSVTEAIELLKQMSELERRVHSAIGLIIAWLWFISGHSLLIDLFVLWERLSK
jgi:antirestriction protein ArdC